MAEARVTPLLRLARGFVRVGGLRAARATVRRPDAAILRRRSLGEVMASPAVERQQEVVSPSARRGSDRCVQVTM